MVQEIVAHGRGNGMPVLHREVGLHGKVDLSMEPMAEPSRAHLGNLPYARRVLRRLPDLFNNLRVYTVEKTREDRGAGLPDHSDDYGRDQQAYERIRQRIPCPDPHCPAEHRETGQTIHPGMVPIRY
jgi:hypothetical protein